MVDFYPLFLNIFLGIVIIILFIFYQGRVKELRRSRQEIEAVLRIRTKARTRELNELAQSLEKKVEKRTEELQGKVEELERFHKLAVGRELKMIKLKEEIEKMKKPLKRESK